jgi:hypothetical protein
MLPRSTLLRRGGIVQRVASSAGNFLRDLQLVVIVHAFHDFSQPVEWLVNLKGYLRPGGAVAIIDRDPDQGAESHFWTRARIEGYAAEAGYDLASSSFDVSRHLILVFRPKAQ